MHFKDVIGQKRIKELLIQTVKEKRISHAQLFLGSEGSGNLALAISFAQYISCLQPGNLDSCGTCSSCIKYQKLIHPDLHFVYPVATTKTVTKDPVSDDFIGQWREIVLDQTYFDLTRWYEKIGIENKQALIGKSESEQIIRKLNLKTYESDYKIMIIWMPEKMNTTAANKLLKILEEPPPFTLFFLVSSSTTNMLPTILSRTQLIKVPAIEKNELKEAIKQRFPEITGIDNIVHLANGNFTRAMELISKKSENEYHLQQFVEIMRLAYKRDITGLNNWVEEITKMGREAQKEFLEYAIKMIRENFILNLGVNEISYLDQEELNFSKNFFPYINMNNVFRIAEEFTNAYADIERNAYSKIVFFDMALKIVKLIKA